MRRLGNVILLISFVAIPSGRGHADPIDDVRQATEAMNQWLGTGEKGDGWRRYLHAEELDDLLAQGSAADPTRVLAVLNRFRQPVSGIDSPEFVAVRDALQSWVTSTAAETAIADWVANYPAVFSPISDQQIEQSRQRAAKAAEELDKLLSFGTPQNKAAWQAYLLWDSIQEQLKPNASPSVDELGAVIAKMYGGQPGVELKEFVDLREALLTHRRLLTAQSDPEFQNRFADQLSALSKELAGEKPSPSQVAARLEWLEQLGQASDVVARVRSQFDNANFYFSASAETIAEGLADNVDQESPVNEMILGTNLRGVAHTVGDISAQLVPLQGKAAIEIILSGVSHSNTVGRRSPVSVFSRGTTQILGRKLLLIEADGVAGVPATASCSTQSQIRGIRADNGLGSRLVEKIAWKRAYEQKAQAERISARRAERRVANMMDRQAAELIAKSNRRLDLEVQRPLRRRNIYPRWVRLWTTKQRLNMRALQGRPIQLSASDQPPAAPAHNVVVQVHESLFLNSAENAIGGFLMTDERAEDLVEQVTGEVPEELRIQQDEDPWSITFDLLQPLDVSFEDDKVTIAIRGRQFTRGDQVVRQTMQIAATYSLGSENGRVKLVRQGDIDVTYPGKEIERLSLVELRNKTFMAKKFAGLFKPEINGEGLELPDRLKELEDLQLDYVSSSNGWLSLGWN